MSYVIEHKTLGDYPNILKFFHLKVKELQLPAAPFLESVHSLDIYIMNGILFDDQGMVYGQLFDGDETQTSLILSQSGKMNPFRVPANRTMILLSNYGDEKFKQSTIVHEISHLMKNYVEGTSPDYSPNGRDELVARDFETQYLERIGLQANELDSHMNQKYYPEE